MSAFQVHDVVSLATTGRTGVVTQSGNASVQVRMDGDAGSRSFLPSDLRLYSRPAPHVEVRVPVVIPEPITVPGQWAVSRKLTSKDTVLSFSPIGGDS